MGQAGNGGRRDPGIRDPGFGVRGSGSGIPDLGSGGRGSHRSSVVQSFGIGRRRVKGLQAGFADRDLDSGPRIAEPGSECPIHALVTSETERQADGGAPEIEIAQRQVEVVVRFVVLQ
jgi:hypothetical protein